MAHLMKMSQGQGVARKERRVSKRSHKRRNYLELPVKKGGQSRSSYRALADPLGQKEKTPSKNTVDDLDSIIGSGASRRGKMFTEKEDILLAKTWIYESENETKGTNQPADIFTENVLSSYNALLEKNQVTGVPVRIRTASSLRLHFTRAIHRDVQYFAGVYSRSKALYRSGWTDDLYLKETLQNYKAFQKRPFTLLDCWRILRVNPKYNGVATPTDASTDAAAFLDTIDKGDSEHFGTLELDESVVTLGAKLNVAGAAAGRMGMDSANRPLGSKKAKKMMRTEQRETDESASLTAHIGSISDTQTTIANFLLSQQQQDALPYACRET